jgi:hypothetical protein
VALQLGASARLLAFAQTGGRHDTEYDIRFLLVLNIVWYSVPESGTVTA